MRGLQRGAAEQPHPEGIDQTPEHTPATSPRDLDWIVSRHWSCSYVRHSPNPCGIPRRLDVLITPSEFAGRSSPFRRRRSHELQCGAAAIALWGMLIGAAASAQNSTDRLTLIWDAPRECPDRGAVLARVANHLRDERKIAENWRAEAHIVRKRAQYELELRVSSDGSQPALRVLRAATCGALADATAVLVALALEPQPSAAGSPSAEPAQPSGSPPLAAGPVDGPAAPAANEPKPSTAAAAPTRPVPPPAAAQKSSQTAVDTLEIEDPEILPAAGSGGRIGLGISAGARFDTGMLPSARAGLRARIELRVLRIRAGLGISWLPPIENAADSYPAASVRASAVLGDGWLGVAVLDSRLSLSPFVVVESGALALESRRIRHPDERTFHWTAIGAGAHASYRLLAGLELGVEVAGVTPVSRPRLWVRTDEGDVTLFHAAAVAVRVAVSIGYVFE
jgi:hypothetical protein